MDWIKWLGEIDWIAVGTFALAMATFGLVIETRRSRRGAETEAAARALRLALVELADAAHHWQTTPPETGSLVYSTPDVAVELPNTRDLLTRVAMPAEVLAYLLWSTEAVRIISSWYLAVIFDRVPQIGNPSGEPGGGWGSEEGQDLWWATLGRVVDTARIVQDECRRWSLAPIATAFAPLFAVELQRNPAPDSLYVATWEGLPPSPPKPS